MGEVRVLSDEPSQARLVSRAWPHLRPHRRRLIVAGLLSVAENAALVAFAPVVGYGVDALAAGDRDGLLRAVVLFGLLVVAQFVLAALAGTGLAEAGEQVVRGLRERVAERLAGAPLRFLEAHRDGSLLQRATGEIAEFATAVRVSLPNLLGVVATLGLTTVVLVGYSWPLTLVVLVVFLPPALLAVRWFARGAGPAFGARAEAEATMAGTFAETLDAREELRASGGLPAWLARFDRENTATLRTQRRTVLVENRVSVVALAEGATLAALLGLGAWLAGRGDLSVGTAVVFVLAARNLFSAFNDLFQLAGDLQVVRTGMARVLDLLAATDSRSGGSALPSRGELAAEGVEFAYETDLPVLRGVTARFSEDTHAGLVGETGSGKTTLAKLLGGLYRPDGGRVTFGGTDLADAAEEEVRRRIALIPQEVPMVTGSVADNLALSPGEPGRERMRAAFADLGVADFPDTLPAGLDTPADALSAGERQIIALARAVLADPPVLVMDEATADIDPATARRLETALATLRRGRTLIVIAHRPSTIDLLPRLVRLRAGQIETGENQ
ncbi:multidrug ABC transporter permease [Acrocarpospora pleiomorpha]|uniref:Multidrug ABC transporter permease n=1 Tax=Acrocarpospora pleiomorpha TaxID=90975 RepID=A0A5M3XNH0_9ACTN|nr:ABC transporter ATP-binding protein [Acrocarpospora pleiomorpha]GES21669.1 multidrug ABC transporter permease [Acrocarpospora pleiomorpha]